MPIADCRLPIADCRLPIAARRLPIADCRLPIADCRLPLADCRLPTADCRLPLADCRLPIALLGETPVTTVIITAPFCRIGVTTVAAVGFVGLVSHFAVFGRAGISVGATAAQRLGPRPITVVLLWGTRRAAQSRALIGVAGAAAVAAVVGTRTRCAVADLDAGAASPDLVASFTVAHPVSGPSVGTGPVTAALVVNTAWTNIVACAAVVALLALVAVLGQVPVAAAAGAGARSGAAVRAGSVAVALIGSAAAGTRGAVRAPIAFSADVAGCSGPTGGAFARILVTIWRAGAVVARVRGAAQTLEFTAITRKRSGTLAALGLLFGQADTTVQAGVGPTVGDDLAVCAAGTFFTGAGVVIHSVAAFTMDTGFRCAVVDVLIAQIAFPAVFAVTLESLIESGTRPVVAGVGCAVVGQALVVGRSGTGGYAFLALGTGFDRVVAGVGIDTGLVVGVGTRRSGRTDAGERRVVAVAHRAVGAVTGTAGIEGAVDRGRIRAGVG